MNRQEIYDEFYDHLSGFAPEDVIKKAFNNIMQTVDSQYGDWIPSLENIENLPKGVRGWYIEEV